MKSHERRAIEKAMEAVIDNARRGSSYPYEIPRAVKRNIPHEAVRLAMLRARRTYDYRTEAEALEYAGRLLAQYTL